MVLETPSDQLHRVARIPLFNMLQRYKKSAKPPNISATFFAKKHTLFCIVNNPSLLPDKGMLLRDKGMLLPAGSYAESRKCGKRTLSSSSECGRETFHSRSFLYLLLLILLLYILLIIPSQKVFMSTFLLSYFSTFYLLWDEFPLLKIWYSRLFLVIL